MIFARRAIQRRLNELRATLGAEAVEKLANRLNRPGKDRLAAMWEVAVLHSLAPLGVLANEVALVSGKCPDVTFCNSAISFIADITAVSDEGLDEQNPYRELSDELEKLKNRLGLKVGGTPPVRAALAKQGLTFEFCVARHRADANELQTSWLISGSRF